jgi:hypothetical protein
MAKKKKRKREIVWQCEHMVISRPRRGWSRKGCPACAKADAALPKTKRKEDYFSKGHRLPGSFESAKK